MGGGVRRQRDKLSLHFACSVNQRDITMSRQTFACTTIGICDLMTVDTNWQGAQKTRGVENVAPEITGVKHLRDVGGFGVSRRVCFDVAQDFTSKCSRT